MDASSQRLQGREQAGTIGHVTTALDRPGAAALFTQWTPQPVAIAVVVLLIAGYLHGLRLVGRPWPAWRIGVFALGIVLLTWTSCGFLQVYADSVYWVWTTQALL